VAKVGWLLEGGADCSGSMKAEADYWVATVSSCWKNLELVQLTIEERG